MMTASSPHSLVPAPPRSRPWLLASGLALTVALTACNKEGKPKAEADYPDASRYEQRITGSGYKTLVESQGSVLGSSSDGFSLLGNNKKGKSGGGASGISVNSYLWYAALDSIAFMPLISADPFGGVIVTDWHSPPESENERFKVNLLIKGGELRADALRVAVFRQERAGAAGWVDASVDERSSHQMTEAILKHARQLRVEGIR